jgi:hypothetical protein
MQFPNRPHLIQIVTWWASISGVLFGDSMYCTLWYSALLRYTVHCYKHAVTFSQPLVGSGFQPYSGFQNHPLPQLPASNSNSSHKLNCSSPLSHFTPLYSSALHSLTELNSVGCVIWPLSGPQRKHHFLQYLHRCVRAAVSLYVLRPLPSNEYICHMLSVFMSPGSSLPIRCSNYIYVGTFNLL